MFEYINLLKKPELRRFEVFIRSPYFNTYKTIILLFEYLKTIYPKITKADVTALKISKVVYSEEKVNALKIRKLCSDFKKLFEKFLHHEFIEKKTLIIREDFLIYLFNREMHDLFYSKLDESNSLLKNMKVKNEDYYFMKYRLNLITSTNSIDKGNYVDYKMYNEGIRSIDHSFILTKIGSIVYFTLLKLQNNAAPLQSINFEKEVLEFIESRKKEFAKDHSYIYLLNLSYKIFTTFDDKYYYLLINYFNKNREKLKGSIMIYYYSYRYFYLKIRLNAFTKNYAAYQNKLYNLFIETFKSSTQYKFFFMKGLMQNTLYFSVVDTYLSQGDMENTITFIHKFKRYIHKDAREDSYYFALGKYYHSNNELQTALLYYNKISNRSIVLKFSRKAVLMRIYFELDDMISLNNEMINMYQFSLRNKKAGEIFKQKISLYLKYFRFLIKLKSLKFSGKKNLSYEKNVLKKQIENEDNSLHPKSWFTKMVNSI